MIAAVESYLAVRRSAGFTLSNTEYLLRSFAGFATLLKQPHVRTATAIDWAGQAKSVAQRHTRYQTICRFAQYLLVEDAFRTSIRGMRSRTLFSPPRSFHRPTGCSP
jgi:integrase/recombinase XerD